MDIKVFNIFGQVNFGQTPRDIKPFVMRTEKTKFHDFSMIFPWSTHCIPEHLIRCILIRKIEIVTWFCTPGLSYTNRQLLVICGYDYLWQKVRTIHDQHFYILEPKSNFCTFELHGQKRYDIEYDCCAICITEKGKNTKIFNSKRDYSRNECHHE